MKTRKIVFAFLLTVSTAMTCNCIKISTVGFEGRNLTPGVARDGMDHSEELAYNCATTAENMSRENPDAYVNCRITQEEMEVEYDPNPPPPPEPQYGVFYSTGWDRTQVIVESRQGRHHVFTINNGERVERDLMPGTYLVLLSSGNRRVSVTFVVDNNHNDSPFAGQDYDFRFEVTRF